MRTTQKIEVSKHDLPIDEKIELHKKGWKVQKIGWAFIFLIMLLGLLGFYGEGIMSEKVLTAGEIHVEYDQLYRYEKEMKVLITADAGNIQTVTIPQQYIQQFKISSIVPQPQASHMEGDEIIYQFSGSGNKVISVYMIPEVYGNVKGNIKVNNQTFSIHHFIFP